MEGDVQKQKGQIYARGHVGVAVLGAIVYPKELLGIMKLVLATTTLKPTTMFANALELKYDVRIKICSS